MVESIIFRPLEGTERLTVATLKVAQEIFRTIGDRTERVDYNAIAGVVHMTWSGVSYAVNALVKAQVLEKTSNGKLRVLRKIVI